MVDNKSERLCSHASRYTTDLRDPRYCGAKRLHVKAEDCKKDACKRYIVPKDRHIG